MPRTARIDIPGRYPWSGHAVLLGNRSLPGQAVEEVLGRSGDKVGADSGAP